MVSSKRMRNGSIEYNRIIETVSAKTGNIPIKRGLVVSCGGEAIESSTGKARLLLQS